MKSRIISVFAALLVSASVWSQVPVDINSGNPRFPFPQFLAYSFGDSHRLDNLGTKNSEGVVHAEMEQDIRDAYQIYANEFDYTGDVLNGVKYIRGNIGCPYDCTEGTGYSLLAAALMGDKTTFDGLWCRTHDTFRGRTKRYLDCSDNQSDYGYGLAPLAEPGGNTATDGDVDIALALYVAWMQWGDFMGINDNCGNPISYKKEMLEVIRGLVNLSTRFPTEDPKRVNSGDVGLDGYLKNGDTWTEQTQFVTSTNAVTFPQTYNLTALPSGQIVDVQGQRLYPEYGGPQTLHIDYAAPSYFREFYDLLGSVTGTDATEWERGQYRRAEASSDWLVGEWVRKGAKNIPIGGWASLDASGTNVTWSSFSQGEDFRAPWRTILNYVWHGNPSYTWDPVTHTVKDGGNSYELNAGKRLADYMNDPIGWAGAECTKFGGGPKVTYTGPATLQWDISPTGAGSSAFTLNWVPACGTPAAVASQDLDLLGLLYRQCNIEWDIQSGGLTGYIDSEPVYFHGWFRLLGMLVASGNLQAPSQMIPKPNMKIYRSIEDSLSFAYTGDVFTYHLDYRNYGSVDATGVKIVEQVPEDFIFVSAQNGGVYDAATHTVTWEIGNVPGLHDKNVAATKGKVSYSVKVGPNAFGRYCTTAEITCTNGLGWTSNEYPNHVTATMQRSCVDVIKRSLKIEKTANLDQVNPGNVVTYTIKFENSSDAGWLDGGRPRVNIATANTLDGSQNWLKFRLFNDAIEPYINYGNYRISYYFYDSNMKCLAGDPDCSAGWGWYTAIYEGKRSASDKVTVSHETVVEGSDEYGKWNQRMMVQFAPLLVTTTAHLSNYYGMGTRIHRGGTEPLRVAGYLYPSNWAATNYTDDWSYNANAADPDDGLYHPVTPSWQEIDPATGQSVERVVNEYLPSVCTQPRYTIPNLLVEEYDGYVWRRILGTGPMAGRDAYNVVVCDTLPKGLTFLDFQSACPLESYGATMNASQIADGRWVVKWSIPTMQIKQKGSIVYMATADFPSGKSCETADEDIDNVAWIYADLNSPLGDTATVTVTCAKVPPPIEPTTLTKTPDVETVAVGDQITYTLEYEQTHGYTITNAGANASDWTCSKASVSAGKISLNSYETADARCDISKSVNSTVSFDAQFGTYSSASFYIRNDVMITVRTEHATIKVSCTQGGTTLKTAEINSGGATNFKFIVDATDDVVRMWVDKGMENSADLTVEGVTPKEGCFGFHNTEAGCSFSNINIHTDCAYNLSIVDEMPAELKYLSSDNGGVLAGGEVVWQFEQGMNNPIPFGKKYKVTVTAEVVSCSEKIINIAGVRLLGHADDEILAKAVVECGESCPQKPAVTSPITYCQGDVADPLTATGVNLKWYTSATGSNSKASITPSTTTAGTTTYYVSQTENGCESDRAEIEVVVNAKPELPQITTNLPVCVGEELTLSTDEVTGATYEWIGPNSFASTNQNVSFASAATDHNGTYSLTITSADGCVSPTAEQEVEVIENPEPPTVVSPVLYCQGETAQQLSAEGESLAWYASDKTALATAPTPSTATVENVSYYVSQTVNGCESTLAEIEVQTLAPPSIPTIITEPEVCDGGEINLSSYADGDYTWSGPDDFTSTEKSPTIVASQITAGEYSLVITVGNCSSEAGTATVIVNPIPSTPRPNNNGPKCEGEQVTVSVDEVAGATYAWTGPDNFLATTSSAPVELAGDYSVTIAVKGCKSAEGTTSVVFNEIPEAPTVTSPISFCKDETVSTALTAEGTSLAWYETATATTAIPAPKPSTATVGKTSYFVSQTVNGCESPRAEIEVQTLEPPSTPVIVTDPEICAESNIVLSCTSDGDFIWEGPNGFSSNEKSPTIKASATTEGEYSLIVRVGNCISNVATATVKVNPIPTVTINPVSNLCEDSQDATLSANVSPTGGVGTWSGTGVSGMAFSPATAGVGSHEITYEYTANNCTNSATTTINVQGKPEVSFALPATACKLGSTISLAGNQTGGTFTAMPSIDLSAGFNPALATVGQDYKITYEYSDGVCSNSMANNIMVYNPAQPVGTGASKVYTKVTAGNIPQLSATGVNQIWYADESLTTKVGEGNTFTPAEADVLDGTQGKVGEYTYYVVSTDGGCVSEKTAVTLEITSCEAEVPVPVNIVVEVCDQASAKPLEVTAGIGNIRWYYEGTKVQDDPATSFTPTQTAAGQYTYSVSLFDTDANCESGKTNITYVIHNLPSVNFTPQIELCKGDSELDLTSAKSQVSGKIFDEANNEVSSFNPVSAGSFDFTYSYTDEHLCTNTKAVTITVHDLPAISILPIADKCEYDAAFDLTAFGNPVGGTFSGNGVQADGKFNPAMASTTVATEISYTYTDANSCTNTTTASISVMPKPSISFGLVPSACVGGDSFDLSTFVSPKGGEFTGNHVSGTAFSPDAIGDFEVEYSYTQNGCSNVSSRSVKVNSKPTVDINVNPVLCVNSGEIVPTLTPAGGVLSLNSSTISAINTNTLVADNYALLYEYTDPLTHCSNETTKSVEIRKIASPQVPDKTIVFGSTDLELVAQGNGGTLTWRDQNNNKVGTGETINHAFANQINSWNYYVTESDGICESEPTCMKFQIIDCPLTAPIITESTVVACDNEDAPTLTAQAENTIRWYAQTDPTTILHTGATFTPDDVSTLGNHRFVATQFDGTCESPSTMVTVQTKTTAKPTIQGNREVCEGEELVLIADGMALWYTDESLAMEVENNTFYQASYSEGSTLVYVTKRSEYCTSNPTVVEVVANPVPESPQISVDDICQGDDLEFTAEGENIEWKEQGVKIGTGNSLIKKNLMAGIATITATQTVNGCVSEPSTAEANIIAIPTKLDDSEITICDYEPTPELSVHVANSAVVKWYSDETATTLVHMGEEYTPTEKVSQTFYVTQSEDNCTSEPAQISLYVNESPEEVQFRQRETILSCEGNTSVIVSESSNTVRWYAEVDGNPIFTGRYFTVPNTEVGEYTYYAQQIDKNGCVGLMTPKNVRYEAGPTPPTVEKEDVICEYDSPGELRVKRQSESEIVSWIAPSGATIDLGDTLVVPDGLITKPGTYIFRARTTVATCSFESRKEVEVKYVVNPKPEQPTVEKTAFCHDGTAVKLSTQAADPIWLGTDGNVLAAHTQTYQTIFTEVGNYNVSLIQIENECSSDTVKIPFLISKIPVPTVQGKNQVCAGANEVYVVSKSNEGNKIDWEVSGERVTYEISDNSTGFVRSVDWTSEGWDTIYVAETNQYECKGYSAYPVEVTAAPDVQFETFAPGQEGVVTFINNSEEQIISYGKTSKTYNVDYYWDLGRKTDTATVLRNERQFQERYPYGDHFAKLTAKNEFGCTASTEVAFFVDVKHGLFFPTAFCPEGTSGEVRVFKPKGFNCRTFKIQIYDNWNNLVYYSEGVNEHGAPLAEWDGCVDGRPLQAGVYRYRMEATFEDYVNDDLRIDESVKPIWGSVQLIR